MIYKMFRINKKKIKIKINMLQMITKNFKIEI